MQTILGKHWHHLDAQQALELLDTSKTSGCHLPAGENSREDDHRDHGLTAVAIARKLGIKGSDDTSQQSVVRGTISHNSRMTRTA